MPPSSRRADNSTSPIPVIMDVDTGVDDAFSLMFAVRHPGIDLRAVTCVAGNTNVEQVVANTLYVLDAAGAGDIPVGRGSAYPLVVPPAHAAHVHGGDGLGGFSRPSDRRVRTDARSNRKPSTRISVAQ